MIVNGDDENFDGDAESTRISTIFIPFDVKQHACHSINVRCMLFDGHDLQGTNEPG